jgi:LytS/YehU family sensor histidine kinase
MMPVPKMIVQIHVENALKHGILPLEKNGYLTIRIFPEHENIVIEIADNGVGRALAQTSLEGSTGKGLAVMDQYADLFNKYHPGKIKSEIEDLYDQTGKPKGTKVKITLSENL